MDILKELVKTKTDTGSFEIITNKAINKII